MSTSDQSYIRQDTFDTSLSIWKSTEVCDLYKSNNLVYKRAKSDISRSSFLSERNALRDLSSIEGVIKYVDSFEDNGSLFLVMEYFDGQQIKMCNLSDNETVLIMLNIIATIIDIHDKGYCHFDLTPNNIILNKVSKDFRVIDFGSSVPSKTGKYDVTSFSTFTPPNMNNPSEIDAYALGVTLYYAVNGMFPFIAYGGMKGKLYPDPSTNGNDLINLVIDGLINPDARFRMSLEDAAEILLKHRSS